MQKSYDDILEEKWERLRTKLSHVLAERYNTQLPSDPEGFFKVLQRIRRNRPKDLTAALRIPPFAYEYHGLTGPVEVEMPGHPVPMDSFTWWTPAPPTSEPIIISKKHFRCYNIQFQRIQESKDPASVLRREIDRFEKQSTSPANANALLNTTDPLALPFSFMALQRRLQLKVVSDMGWTRFLQQGEGKEVWQNDWGTLSSFEMKLYEMATSRAAEEIDWNCLSAITLPPGVRGQGRSSLADESNLARITKCCLLMEAYVAVHGEGDMSSLVYKQGVRDEPRGPVDQYNTLCTILSSEKKKLAGSLSVQTPNLPGPSHKFLAKDIMSWNNAFKDDAFAGK